MRASLVVCILLSGCASVPGAMVGEDTPEVGLPADWDIVADGCLTTTVFFLVDEERAHPFLPIGFRPRDLSGFLYNTPVTAGKIPAFLAVSTCETFQMAAAETHNMSLEVGYLGFFIDPPAMTTAYANSPATYDFYAVRYLAPSEGPGSGPVNVTSAYRWATLDADVAIEVDDLAGAAPSGHPMLSEATNGTLAPDRFKALLSRGGVQINGSDVFRFSASGFFPQAFPEPPTLRFWQAAPRGVGFMEFELPQRTVAAGPLDECWLLPGTILHEVAGDRQGSVDGSPCGLTESFALVFGDHALKGELHHLEGVHP